MFKIQTFFSRLFLSFLAVIITVIGMMTLVVYLAKTPTMQVVGIISAVLLGAGLSLLLTIINSNIMIKPMKELIEMTNKVSKGEFGTRAKVIYADDDINHLAYNLNKMANEFENLEQMRKSFVANASHELRSPLTSIQGFIQGVLDGTIGEEDRNKYLTIVYNETRRLSQMITSMLDLSRIDSGKFPIIKSKFELNELIRRVVIKFEPLITKNDMKLGIDLIKDYSYVYADKDRIEQVLVNLLDNAIKYSHHSTKIQITTHIHSDKLYVSIKDEGIGISKRDQMLIWDRFYTADKARTPGKSKGTGLGLSIIKKIIDEHKEVIWVESNRGEGTTFIFTLAIFNPQIHAVGGEKKPVAEPNTVIPPTATPEIPKKSVPQQPNVARKISKPPYIPARYNSIHKGKGNTKK